MVIQKKFGKSCLTISPEDPLERILGGFPTQKYINYIMELTTLMPHQGLASS